MLVRAAYKMAECVKELDQPRWIITMCIVAKLNILVQLKKQKWVQFCSNCLKTFFIFFFRHFVFFFFNLQHIQNQATTFIDIFFFSFSHRFDSAMCNHVKRHRKRSQNNTSLNLMQITVISYVSWNDITSMYFFLFFTIHFHS